MQGNFVSDFVHHAGTSEVPRLFVRWAALSALAGALSDRVWMAKGASRVRPNLYVFLIGPSGLGKGEAINLVLRLYRDLQHIPVEYGRVTAAALIDRLAIMKTMGSNHAKVYLATPELAMAVGRGPQADDLIKLTTELYGGAEVPLIERTRTNGRHVIKGHCLNWIAGTTREWLRDCVTREAVEGGFFARVACVQASYPDRRVHEPSLPKDYEQTSKRLKEHLSYLHEFMQGEINFDARAEDIHRSWYLERPRPQDDILLPSWRREDDFVRKVAMLLAMAEPNPERVIRAKHVTEAQVMVSDVSRLLPTVIDFIGTGTSPDGEIMRRVRQVIAEAGSIHHTVLARQASRLGVTSDKLRLCIDTLIESGLIRRDRQITGSWKYAWLHRAGHISMDHDQREHLASALSDELPDSGEHFYDRDDDYRGQL